MTTLNISLPEAMRAFIEQKVAQGGYGKAVMAGVPNCLGSPASIYPYDLAMLASVLAPPALPPAPVCG
jgi:hypothetical protein